MAMSAAQKKIKKWREDPVSFVVDELKVVPDAWQAEVLRHFATDQRIAMKAPLAIDNIVYTPDGCKIWGDINKGDKLFAEDGSVSVVVRRYNVGVKSIYRVKFRDGSWVDTCGEHEWKVQTAYDRRIGKTRVLSTNEIIKTGLTIKSGQRKINIPIQGAAQYPQKKLPLDPYVLGLWIGDGCRNEPSITCPDSAIKAEIEKRGFDVSLKKDKKTIRILGSNQSFIKTGINDLYCYEKWIPDEYRFSSKEQRLDLLRGLMDSDGTTAINGHTYYAGSSERLIDDVVLLARSLGYLAKKLGPYKINNGENRDSYRAVVTGKECPFLAETSKKIRWREPSKFRYTRFIDSIIPVGKKECMCVEIDDQSHCFLANDFIVTHNCKGPGKTTIEAWCAWNFLATRLHPKIAATSISADNLSDNLWAEMAKWMNNSPFLKRSFVWTKTRIFSRDHPETWWMSARSWAKTGDSNQQADTLAGLHADYMLFILDEVGGIPDAVMVAAEAGLASGIETKILMGGNPTHLEGPLYRACTKERHLWWVIEITGDPDDPMRSPRVSAKWAKDQIDTYGRENPWVLVNVFGRFPPSSINTLLGPEEVSASMKRHLDQDKYIWSQKRIGVDVARFGDDRTVLFPRQGLVAFRPVVMRHERTTAIAARLMMAKERWKSHMEFIDDSGHWGHGVIDNMIAAGHSSVPVMFGDPAIDPRYKNRRTEMWLKMAEWVKRGGVLPNMPELMRELTAPTYTFVNGKLALEDKDLIKKRISGMSTDLGDGLCLTFAIPDMPADEMSDVIAQMGFNKKMKSEFDPFASDRMDY